MPISNQKARAVTTKSEFALFRASLPKSVVTLAPSVLKRDIARARNLRDKSRQQAKTHARAGKDAERTKVKAQLFDESLKRFEAQLRVVEKAAKKKAQRTKAKAKGRPKKTTKAKAKRPPGKKTVVRKKAAKRSPAKRPPATRQTSAKAKPTAKMTPARKAATKNRSAATTLSKRSVSKAKPRKRPTSVAAEGKAKRGQARRSGRTRIRTHVSARGRRSQAKRDTRR